MIFFHKITATVDQIWKNFAIMNLWRQKCSKVAVNEPLTEKTWRQGWVVLVVETKWQKSRLNILFVSRPTIVWRNSKNSKKTTLRTTSAIWSIFADRNSLYLLKFPLLLTTTTTEQSLTTPFKSWNNRYRTRELCKNQGAWFDLMLSMDTYINKVFGSGFYYLHNLRRIKKYLSHDCLVTLIEAFVTGRLDYCNSLMYGLPQCQISKLRRVQNSAARIALDLSKFCHITPALQQLHWLPFVKHANSIQDPASHFQDYSWSLSSLYQWTYNCQTQIYPRSLLKQQYSAATSYTENAAYTWCLLLCCCCLCALEQTACCMIL